MTGRNFIQFPLFCVKHPCFSLLQQKLCSQRGPSAASATTFVLLFPQLRSPGAEGTLKWSHFYAVETRVLPFFFGGRGTFCFIIQRNHRLGRISDTSVQVLCLWSLDFSRLLDGPLENETQWENRNPVKYVRRGGGSSLALYAS